MNGQGIAAALLLLVAVTAVRMGDKPTFRTKDIRKQLAEGIEVRLKAAVKEGKGTYIAEAVMDVYKSLNSLTKT